MKRHWLRRRKTAPTVDGRSAELRSCSKRGLEPGVVCCDRTLDSSDGSKPWTHPAFGEFFGKFPIATYSTTRRIFFLLFTFYFYFLTCLGEGVSRGHELKPEFEPVAAKTNEIDKVICFCPFFFPRQLSLFVLAFLFFSAALFNRLTT